MTNLWKTEDGHFLVHKVTLRGKKEKKGRRREKKREFSWEERRGKKKSFSLSVLLSQSSCQNQEGAYSLERLGDRKE